VTGSRSVPPITTFSLTRDQRANRSVCDIAETATDSSRTVFTDQEPLVLGARPWVSRRRGETRPEACWTQRKFPPNPPLSLRNRGRSMRNRLLMTSLIKWGLSL
jgi:hypothetical protein